MDTYINGISYYLPEQTLCNNEINKNFPEWNADKISKKTGIKNRHIAANDEFASDMAIKAANKLFSTYNIDKDKIELLIYCTQSPDYFLPTTSCIMQNKLGLKTSIGAFDFNLGCSGYVYGLSMAKSFIASGMLDNVLFLTSNTYSKFINPKDKSNKTIFGDAATASLISSNKGIWRIDNFVLGTDGRGAENLIVKNNGIRNKIAKGFDIFNESGEFTKNDDNIFMNGGEIFNFTSKAVPSLINSLLVKNNLTLDKIDAFVFHQANKFMLEYIRRKIKIQPNKFIYYLEQVGNTVSNTIPIALKEKCEQRDYQKIVLAGFGVGYSWGGCVLSKV